MCTVAIQRKRHHVALDIRNQKVFFLLGSCKLYKLLNSVSTSWVLANSYELLWSKRCQKAGSLLSIAVLKQFLSKIVCILISKN